MKASLPVAVLSLGVLGFAATRQPAKAQPEVSFGRDVSPIISQHCFKCHGPDAAKAAAGLRLDNFAGATKQLGDGAAIVPGKPDQSILIKRVSEKDPEMRMPPTDAGVGALTPEQIKVVSDWIAQGAHYEKHWAYVPPAMPKIPKVSDPKWCKNLVDQLVMARLDKEALKPEPEADRDTLALRAAQALTGLPPTQADLDSYRSDKKPGAYERYVDHLMAEPTYGENEARYWLDAVRYADTHGLQLDNERSVYPYRDWVVRAFNQDLPYNQFTEWQVAGDLLPKPTTDQLVATGYVRMNLTSNEGGAIPEEFLARNTFDRVDTTSTVFLGLTFGCAKCHDHKFDPIKQRDYYGLYAYFDSTKDEPLDGNIPLPPPYAPAPSPEQDAQLAAIKTKIALLTSSVQPSVAEAWCEQNHHPVPVTRDWQISPVYSADSFDHAFDQRGAEEPGQSGKTGWKPFSFTPGKDMAGIIGKDNSSVYVKGTVSLPAAQQITLGVSSDDAVKVWLNGKLIHSHKVSRGLAEGIDMVKADFHAGDNELIAKVINGAGPDGLNIRLTDPLNERVSKTLADYRKSPVEALPELRTLYLDSGPAAPDAAAYRGLIKEQTAVIAAIPMTLIAQEMDKPRPTFILRRGEYDQKGDPVHRHIPPILGDLPPGAPNNRLGLAEWMISPNNPLVSRVFVNRAWQQFFGTGIVKTVEDFGSQGEWPENQPLLDYLAVSFEKNGWSVKKLNRLIVTSAAFRQSSRTSPSKELKDPENRLVSRGPRYRLDAEVIRDKALADAGLLVEKQGGHGFKPYQPAGLWEAASDPASATHVYVQDHGEQVYRRSMYQFWKRTSPPPVLTTFDSPVRDTCIVRRSRTNTPLQALAMLNEPEFLEASRVMAQRLLSQKADDERRIDEAYEIALDRKPRPEELSLFKRVLAVYRLRYTGDPSAAKKLLAVGESPQSKTIPTPEQAAWMLICSTLMNTDEFLSLQ